MGVELSEKWETNPVMAGGTLKPVLEFSVQITWSCFFCTYRLCIWHKATEN